MKQINSFKLFNYFLLFNLDPNAVEHGVAEFKFYDEDLKTFSIFL